MVKSKIMEEQQALEKDRKTWKNAYETFTG